METPIHYNHCPVCGSADIRTVMEVKDYTVSGQQFPVAACAQCTLRFTQDVPGPGSIGPYYRSEDYISHTNTSKGIVNRLYQSVRRITVRQKRKLVRRQTGLRQGSLLDIGSGTGVFAAAMQAAGWQVTGLEPDEGARAVAKSLQGIELQEPGILYQLPPASFDAITLWHVLEHVHDLQGYLERIKLLLKPGGRLIIAVPNYTSKDAAVYGPYWAAWDVPRHLYHFSPQAMEVLLDRHAFRVLQYRPMWFDSFYVSMLSSKYRNGRTNLLAAGWNGLRSNIRALGNKSRCSSVIYIAGKNAEK